MLRTTIGHTYKNIVLMENLIVWDNEIIPQTYDFIKI